MDDIVKLRNLYQLKNIYRVCMVGNRDESVAEHCWSALLLAGYFLEKTNQMISRSRVYDLLIYHDLLELETGDIPVHDTEGAKLKKKNESDAIPVLMKKIPTELRQRFIEHYEEFEANESMEAKFANAIDKLDPMIQCLYDKDLFIKYGYTEELIRDKKQGHMEIFPEILHFYEVMMRYFRDNGYF